MATEQPPIAPIIVIKKKGGHAGHHGGAWKVAYADFVTAMMALFIVLWLMSSSSKATQEQIAGYFNDPKGTATKHGSIKQGVADNLPLRKEDLAKLKEALLQSIHKVSDLQKLKGQIDITITDEGLRIELMEDKKGTFFETGSAQPTPILVELLKLLAVQMGAIPNKISVEGHTDAQPYAKETTYGNWELSADRANVARRLMQANGVRADQISQVRGFADQRLRKPDQPFDASNRRISLIVQYMESVGAPGMKNDVAAAGKGEGEAKAGAANEGKAGADPAPKKAIEAPKKDEAAAGAAQEPKQAAQPTSTSGIKPSAAGPAVKDPPPE